MECCHPTHKLYPCRPCAPPLGLDLQPGAKAVGKMLQFLFGPDDSTPGHPQPALVKPAWMGPVKALFWVAFSIVAGLVLANLCS